MVAYGKSGRSEAALRGLRAAERLGEPYRHDRDRHPDDGDDVDDGRLVRPEQVVEDPYRQGGRALSERIDMEKSALETDRPGRVVLHGLLDLRPPCRSNGSRWPSMRPWLERWPRAVTGLGTDALTGQHGLIGR